ncbi:MAG: GntP family permease [Chitinophagaceae bacterium]|nr:GntP family permease [Chitinophagaceae bacterium]
MITGIPLLIVILAVLILIIVACSYFKWHPFLVLLFAAILLGLSVGMPADKIVNTVIQGGGNLFAGIGIIIASGTILGEILERTGAAQQIALLIIKLLGKKRIISAVTLLGAVTGIPVFCDSGFVILSNLARSLAVQSKTSYTAISIALATGLYTTHVLVPPTPGPLAAAGNLGMANELGWVILTGLVVSVPALAVSYWRSKKLLAITGEMNLPVYPVEVNHQLPSSGKSVLLLLLPVLLIAFGSFISFLKWNEDILIWLLFISNPNIALLISVIAALVFAGLPYKKEWNRWMGNALSQAGPIILITAAGGSLGAVLKATSLAELFEQWLKGQVMSSAVIFIAAYLLAAGLKTAQGSSTAALVIASSIISSLMSGFGIDTAIEKSLLVMSIGAGAMTVSHANDSYFWVISQYSHIPVEKMYRHFTLTTFYMGLAVLLTCLLLSFLL